MPARYWLPLVGLERPVPVEHLHGALSGWFDHLIAEDLADQRMGEVDPHDFTEKPYAISPTTRRGHAWGIEVAVMGRRTEQALCSNADAGTAIRLGRTFVKPAPAARISGVDWQELKDYDGTTAWAVEFVTPFTTRTGNRSSPFPQPASVLRAPTTVWEKYSPLGPIEVPRASHSPIWVSSIDVRTEVYQLKGLKMPGLLGRVVYRCSDAAVAPAVSTLLRFAEFSGVGSFRGKGMGIVNVTPL